MAGLKDSFSKGLTTINIKTSNFMEENKLKTHIATQEAEIEKMKLAIGESVYQNWDSEGFTLQSLASEVDAIKQKYAVIEDLKKQIEDLAQKEKQILGETETESVQRIFCTTCGNELKMGVKFCKNCGSKIEE